ncbi:Holliday junction branch migration protein RuvA [Candidatus Poriferisocius sp.]|uniref:Holliday junction branch migration protein RuvA n=1 Tax=Candidatus Poriferisocius sp. TaxID=3101276 RepID=UPI003B0202BF
MIGLLRGTLALRDHDEVIVEAAGVGYRVTVAPETSASLGELGQEVLLHTHHHIREDAQTLYGFDTPDKRRVFEGLISAHGVGPSMGMAIMSVFGPAELAGILATDDINALCLVPGVGKKTAARLLVELKSRLDIGDVTSALASDRPEGEQPSDARNVVRQALAELGYSAEEIRAAIAALPPGDNSSALLKEALRHLASGV